jgi:hypothetical protein
MRTPSSSCVRALFAFLVVLGLANMGCASRAAGPVPVAVVLRGDAALVPRVRTALAKPEDDVALRFSEVPSAATPAAAGGNIEGAVAEARKQYLVPDVPRCLAALPDEPAIAALMAQGRRALVARVLFWRVACHVAAGSLDDARHHAAVFASLELEVPQDAGAASPEVEAVLARELKEASAAPTSALHVTSKGPALAVSVDGKPTPCVTPCTLTTRRGRHYLHAEADGVMTEDRVVATLDPKIETTFVAAAAPPDVAAQQWSFRYAASPLADSSASVRLLAQATRARNLMFVQVERAPGATHLRGVLAVGGEVKWRAERSRAGVDIEEDVGPLVKELLQEGKVVESTTLTKRPLFWICVGAAALLAAGTTYLILRPRPSRTEVRF